MLFRSLRGRGGRVVLERLVTDSRFDDIPEYALRALILKVNAWLPAPVVEYPYESVADNERKAVFSRWRNAVRESVPRWK